MANINGSVNGEVIDALDGVTNGNDFIFGDGGNDTIYGLGGNDVLKGGGGADKLYGGTGIDTASYLDSGAGVSVSLFSGKGFGGTAAGDQLFEIENLSGSSYDDTLLGNANANTLYGNAGNDVLSGGGGADKLYGDSGIDTASYFDSGSGVVVSLASGLGSGGTAAGDQLFEIENLIGSSYNDTLLGNANANSLYGNAGNDVLNGGPGADQLYGGSDNDTLFSDAVGDFLDGGTGNDTVDFTGSQTGVKVSLTGFESYVAIISPVSLGWWPDQPNLINVENVSGSNYNDRVWGSDLDNVLTGNAGDDRLTGGGGNDTINGGIGKDFIYGDAGNDLLTGGAGSDTFVYDKYPGAPVEIGKDIITDFTVGVDEIVFYHDFDDFADVKAHMQQVGNNVVITYDANNSVTLQNVNIGSLSANDFLFF